MQIENDYDKEVYNGDIGTINRVDPAVGEIIATFDGRTVTYGLASSIPWCRIMRRPFTEAKVSEYPAVIIPVQHYAMLQRSYTGVER